MTGDVGPRIMRYGFVGGQNFFKEFTEQLGKSGEKEWQARGGHRLWIGPEDKIKSYAPDNGPIHIEIQGDVLEATEPVEPLTGLEKKITVRMAATGTACEVIHTLRNAGKAPSIWRRGPHHVRAGRRRYPWPADRGTHTRRSCCATIR